MGAALARSADLLLDAHDGRWFYSWAAPRQRPTSNLRLVSDHTRDSVLAADTGREPEKMSHALKAPSLRAETEKVLSEDDIREWVAGTLDVIGPVKQIARAANTTPPGVKNWLMRRHTMSLSAAVHLALRNERFQGALAELIGIPADLLRHHRLQQRAEALRVEAERLQVEAADLLARSGP